MELGDELNQEKIVSVEFVGRISFVRICGRPVYFMAVYVAAFVKCVEENGLCITRTCNWESILNRRAIIM